MGGLFKFKDACVSSILQQTNQKRGPQQTHVTAISMDRYELGIDLNQTRIRPTFDLEITFSNTPQEFESVTKYFDQLQSG